MGRAWPRLHRTLLGLFVFILPLIFSTQNTHFGRTKLAFALGAIAVMLLVWALELAWGRGRLALTRLGWPALGLLAVLGASLSQSINPTLSAEALGVTAYFFLLFLYVANQVRTRADGLVVLGALALSGGLMAGYGLLQYYGAVAGLAGPRVPGEAMLSTLGNKNFLGGMLALAVLPGLTALLLARRAWARGVLLACHGLGVVALLAIQSFGAWLAVAAGGLAWVVGVLAARQFGPLAVADRWLVAWLLTGGGAWWAFSESAPWTAFSQPVAEPRVVALGGRWVAGGPWTVARYDRQSGELRLNAWRTLAAPPGLRGGWPVAGDWDGDGRTDWALVHAGAFHWDVTLDGQPDVVVPYEADGGVPLAGDWDGDGLADPGFYNPQRGAFMLGAVAAAGAVAPAPGDRPVAGDWDGDGRDSVGLFRPAMGAWWLDADGDGVLEARRPLADAPGDSPLVGPGGALGGFDPVTDEVWWDFDGDGTAERRGVWAEDDPLGAWIARLKPSLAIRLEDWNIAVAMLRDRPWLGVGLANYALQFLPYKARLLDTPLGRQLEAVEAHPEVGHIPRAAHAHNEYLHLGAEAGLLGLLALGWMMWAALARGARLLWGRRVPTQAKLVALGVVAALLGVAVEAELGFPFHLPASGGATAMLLGVLFSGWLDGGRPRVARGTRRWLATLVGSALALGGATYATQDFLADLKVQQGITLWTMGMENLGAHHIEQSLGIDPVPTDALPWLGSFYARYDQPGLRQRCVAFNAHALRAFPSEQAYWLLGQCQLALGRWDEALEAFATLARVDPEPVYAARLREALDGLWSALVAQWEAAGVDPVSRRTQEKVLGRMDSAAEIGWAVGWFGSEAVDHARAMARATTGAGGGRAAALALLTERIQMRPGHALAHLGLSQLLVEGGARQAHAKVALVALERQEQLWMARAARGEAAAVDALRKLEGWRAQALATEKRRALLWERARVLSVSSLCYEVRRFETFRGFRRCPAAECCRGSTAAA